MNNSDLRACEENQEETTKKGGRACVFKETLYMHILPTFTSTPISRQQFFFSHCLYLNDLIYAII